MFTGLVQSVGTLVSVGDTSAGKRLVVALGEIARAKIEPGDSVCVAGVCLTVVSVSQGNAIFDVITETLHCTTLGGKKVHDAVNLELSLRGDSFVGGHFVQGHVDAVAVVTGVHDEARDWRIIFEVPDAIAPFIVPKGSVAVEGVSMTVAEVKGNRFTLAVIPTTLEKTTLRRLAAGDKVNVETDILARTVVHYLRQMSSNTRSSEVPGLSLAKLQELGFA